VVGDSSDDRRASLRSLVVGLVKEGLAPLVDLAPAEIGESTALEALGLDSLNIVEVLITVRDELLDREGIDPDEVSDPDSLPHLDTIADLVDFILDTPGMRESG
jgi:acyl carrier protein